MAVSRVTAIHRYIGLALDDKPTGVPVGSTFYAFDGTPATFVYDGTDWHEQ